MNRLHHLLTHLALAPCSSSSHPHICYRMSTIDTEENKNGPSSNPLSPSSCSASALSDSSVEHYIIRSLPPSDLSRWLDFVANVFAAKGTPRSYFERHAINDPYYDPHGIIIALTSSPSLSLSSFSIVSSVRVFLRSSYFLSSDASNNNGAVELSVGGIGEVSTSIDYRGRRLANVCLARALDYMKINGISLSTLHTSQGPLIEYYRGLGYKSIERHFVLFPSSSLLVSSSSTPSTTNNNNSVVESVASSFFSIKELSLKDANQWILSISSLYHQYSQRFNGPFVRSEEYWKRWIIDHLIDASFTPSPIRIFVLFDSSSSISAYLFIQKRSPKIITNDLSGQSYLLITEFGCNHSQYSIDGGRLSWKQLLSYSIQSMINEGKEIPSVIRCPYPIIASFKQIDQKKQKEVWEGEGTMIDIDVGFMYRSSEYGLSMNDRKEIKEYKGKTIKIEIEKIEEKQEMINNYQRKSIKEAENRGIKNVDELIDRLQKNASTHHLFWPIDGF